MHALIIEDELLIAFALEEILQELGFDSVDLADSEATAMEAASRNPPDFITADFELRFGLGTRAVENIQEEFGWIPAIYVTASRHHLNGIPSALIATKPFTRDSIRHAWESACNGCERTPAGE
jgi:DNA-binding response OmpR family regulator